MPTVLCHHVAEARGSFESLFIWKTAVTSVAMNTEYITTWKDLAALGEKYMTSNWIFRGVADATYRLIPRIGRSDVSKDSKTSDDLGYSSDFEDLSLQRFKREALPHITFQPGSELDWLAVAQHHGFPTRLLDWTESPLIGAYFALRLGGFVGKEPRDAAIFGLPWPPVIGKDQEIDTTSEQVLAYFPRHISPRITAQRGLFTYHKTPNVHYDPSNLMQWILPAKACFTLKVILNKCGFNEASMFPDLDGVAKHVAWQLKWRLL